MKAEWRADVLKCVIMTGITIATATEDAWMTTDTWMLTSLMSLTLMFTGMWLLLLHTVSTTEAIFTAGKAGYATEKVAGVTLEDVTGTGMTATMSLIITSLILYIIFIMYM